MLALDVDLLAAMVGGWRDDFSRAHAIASAHARALAVRHLRGGADVVVPQLFTVHDEGSGFEVVAEEAGATYVEVALLVGRAEQAEGIAGVRPRGEVDVAVHALVSSPDAELVARIDDHLEQYLAQRPGTVRLDTTGLDETETYRRLLDVLT